MKRILRQGKLSGGKKGHRDTRKMSLIKRNLTNSCSMLSGILRDKSIPPMPIL